MKGFVSALAVLFLQGCVLGPDADQRWAAYRTQVLDTADAAGLTPSQAQEKLRDGYGAIYGTDAYSAGFYAYSISLLRSAEQGRFPMAEARTLVQAKEAEFTAEREAARRPRMEDPQCCY
jgi:hypothetical protein